MKNSNEATQNDASLREPRISYIPGLLFSACGVAATAFTFAASADFHHAKPDSALMASFKNAAVAKEFDRQYHEKKPGLLKNLQNRNFGEKLDFSMTGTIEQSVIDADVQKMVTSWNFERIDSRDKRLIVGSAVGIVTLGITACVGVGIIRNERKPKLAPQP